MLHRDFAGEGPAFHCPVGPQGGRGPQCFLSQPPGVPSSFPALCPFR